MGVDHLGRLADHATSVGGSDVLAVVGDDLRWTYGDVAAAVRAMAGALHEAGVRRGDRVPLVDVASPLALVTVMATARIGAAAAPINPRLTPAEVATLADLGGLAKVGVAGSAYRDRLDGIVASLLGEEELAGGGDHLEEEQGDEALVLFTSGTTGLPKPVPVPTVTLRERLLPYAVPPAHQVRMLCVPIHHVGGLIGALVCVTGGHTLVVQPRFDAGEWLRLVEKFGVQLVFVVPTMLARILDHPDIATTDLSSLQTVTYGASPMPEDLVVRLTEAMPGVGLVNTFGQTETLGGITLSTPEDATHPVHRASVGRLVPGVRIRIVDPETDADLTPGDVGELLVLSGQNVVDGWIRTGDLVRIDVDGYLYPAGRLADTINRGGEKFGPIEVETALRTHPAVADCAVAGVPDPDLGERVGAVVVCRSDVAVDDLRSWCAERIAKYKTPDLVGFVDAVPLTDMGKVDRKAVVRILQEG